LEETVVHSVIHCATRYPWNSPVWMALEMVGDRQVAGWGAHAFARRVRLKPQH
jgi:hypothetical protein